MQRMCVCGWEEQFQDGWSKQDACRQQEMPERKCTSMACRCWGEGLLQGRAAAVPHNVPMKTTPHAQGMLPGKFPSNKQTNKTPKHLFSKGLQS